MSDTTDNPHTPDATGSTEPAGAAELASTSAAGVRRRRRVLWAALAAFAIAAGTLAVVAADDGGSPPRLPVALGSAGAAAEERSAAAAADMAMMAFVRYSAGDDLPGLGGSGAAYRLSGDLDLEAFRAVATALGLSGEPEVRDGIAHLESDGKALQAAEHGGGAWWYSPHHDDGGGSSSSSGSGSSGMTAEERKASDARAAEAAVSPEGAVADVPADEVEPVEPAEPVQPVEPVEPVVAEDLPTEAEARTIALDLLSAAGMDVDDAEVTVDGPYEAWYVSVEPELGGVPVSGLVASVSVGPEGEVLSANGWLNDPERLGDYPTIDTRAAIDRLNDGSAYGGGAARDTPMPLEEDLVGGDAVDPDAPVSSDDQEPVQIDPMPVEPTTPPEPLEVVLHQAERVLVTIGANDGSTDTYLVPGYRMRDHGGDDAHVVDVPAVDDDSLLPAVEEPVPDTGSVEPGGGTTGCAQPEPGPDGAVPDICLDPNSVPPAEAEGAPGVGEG